MEDESSPKKSFFSNFRNLTLVLAVTAVLFGGLAYYFHGQAKTAKNPEKVAQEEVASLVATVSKLMVLPADETPVIATVVDPEKLKSQPFFAQAKKGYKVLIYNTARKAILFDPVGNKVIDVAPLTVGASPTPAAQ